MVVWSVNGSRGSSLCNESHLDFIPNGPKTFPTHSTTHVHYPATLQRSTYHVASFLCRTLFIPLYLSLSLTDERSFQIERALQRMNPSVVRNSETSPLFSFLFFSIGIFNLLSRYFFLFVFRSVSAFEWWRYAFHFPVRSRSDSLYSYLSLTFSNYLENRWNEESKDIRNSARNVRISLKFRAILSRIGLRSNSFAMLHFFFHVETINPPPLDDLWSVTAKWPYYKTIFLFWPQ